jgi:beta-alanine--pyruvate transaminase
VGAVAGKSAIHDVTTESIHEGGIEPFHRYTYSGHPAALAATVAALDTYRDEKLFEQARQLENHFRHAAMTIALPPGRCLHPWQYCPKESDAFS